MLVVKTGLVVKTEVKTVLVVKTEVKTVLVVKTYPIGKHGKTEINQFHLPCVCVQIEKPISFSCSVSVW